MTGTEEIQNSSAEEDTNSLYVLDENLETVEKSVIWRRTNRFIRQIYGGRGVFCYIPSD